MAEPLNDPGLTLQAHHCAWATLVIGGDLAGANEHVRQGLELYDRKAHGKHALLYGGHDPAVCALGQGGIASWMLGYPDQAAHRVGRGIALADELTHPPSVGHALWFAGIVYMMRGDAVTARTLAERLLRLSGEHSLAQYQAVGGAVRGWARARSGELDDGLNELRISVGSYRATAAPLLVFFMLALADTELRAGHPVEAERALQEGDEGAKAGADLGIRDPPFAGRSAARGKRRRLVSLARAIRRSAFRARGHDAKSFELRAAARPRTPALSAGTLTGSRGSGETLIFMVQRGLRQCRPASSAGASSAKSVNCGLRGVCALGVRRVRRGSKGEKVVDAAGPERPQSRS